MYCMVATRCSDGYIRWHRERVPKNKKEKKVTLPKNPEVLELERLYRFLFEKYFGEVRSFCGFSWESRKVKLAETVLDNIKIYGIDTELFLLSQFEISKKKPMRLLPTHMAALGAIKRCQDWLKSYPTKAQARGLLTFSTLEQVLYQNVVKYLKLKERLRLTDHAIYKTRYLDFDPEYLVSSPVFMALYRENPSAFSNSQHIEAAYRNFHSTPSRFRNFYQTLQGVRCRASSVLSIK